MINKVRTLEEKLNTIIKGKPEAVRLLTIALCAGGNVLMQDVPGVGKTTLAKALAGLIKGRFHRVQFTPDLLPTDIIGCSIYNPREGTFDFREGPVFSNVLLADEINRASPRTQSALLEAMSEQQVSTEGRTTRLPSPFIVLATENPIEYQGTYPLPEAQLDRFAMQLVLGYPEEEHEMAMLFSRKQNDPLDELDPALDCDEIVEVQEQVREVGIEESVALYAVRLIRSSRIDDRIRLGASPRALLSLTRCAQAAAWLDERDFVTPDDIREMAVPVLAHRLVLENKTEFAGVSRQAIVTDLVKQIKAPV